MRGFGIVRDTFVSEDQSALSGKVSIRVSGRFTRIAADTSVSGRVCLRVSGRSNNPLMVSSDRLSAKGTH